MGKRVFIEVDTIINSAPMTDRNSSTSSPKRKRDGKAANKATNKAAVKQV